MRNTGQILKKAREEQSLSVNEVSMATKISPRMLSFIEQGDLANLPAKTFLRGFVRSYAMYLKLDTDQVLSTFHEEMGSTLPEPQIENTTEEPNWTNSKLPPLTDRSNLTKVLAVISILVLIVLIIGIRNIIQKYEIESQVDSPLESLTSLPLPIGNQDSVIAPTDAPSESGEPEPEVLAKTATETSGSEPEVTDEPRAEPTPPSAPTAQESRSEQVATNNETSPEPKPPAPTRNHEILFEALDRVEIVFRTQDGQSERVPLEPDQVYTIKARGSVDVRLSDGGAVNVIYNGRDRGVPGDLGRSKQLHFP